MNDHPDSGVASKGGSQRVDMIRRKLFRGTAAGTGVLLSVHAKTALGTGVCKSPSAILSGNTSPRPGDGTTCSGGRSPGFWLGTQHFPHWREGGVMPPEFKGVVVDCNESAGSKVAWTDITAHGTTFKSVFGAEPVRKDGVAQAGVGLWAAMNFKEEFEGQELIFHIVAAYLNSKYFSSAAQKYPISSDQVVEMYNAVKSGGEYCPSSFVVQSCPGGGWTSAEVISYIQGMFHINDAVPQLCHQPK